jgi:hypothetical protein
MPEPPADFLRTLPPDAESVARAWWDSLTDDQRGRIAGAWDDRLEVRFFTPQGEDEGAADGWDRVPRVVGGRFLPPDDAWGLEEWGPGYFEHLLQHPELVIVWEPQMRTFHIGCTRHATARACLESGLIPEGFECPEGAVACPLRPLRGARLIRPGAPTTGSAGLSTKFYMRIMRPGRSP